MARKRKSSRAPTEDGEPSAEDMRRMDAESTASRIFRSSPVFNRMVRDIMRNFAGTERQARKRLK